MATDEDFEDPDDLLDTEEEDEDEEDEDLDLEIDDDLALDVVADDDDDEVDLEDDDDDADDAVGEEAEESLDVLLAREQGEDDVLVRLDEEPRDGLVTSTTPIGADEFTCTSCFLVKRRAQLADAKQMICFDCA